MKVKAHSFLSGLATVALSLSIASCGPDKQKPLDEASKADEPVAAQIEQPVQEATAALPFPEINNDDSVKVEEGLFEALEEGVQDDSPLGRIVIDTSSMEALGKSIEAMSWEIQKLSSEEQAKARMAFGRYMIDMVRSYPDKQEFMNNEGPPPKEAVEKFAMYMAEPFSGKNFYDFMEDAEGRAEGRPPIEEEMRHFMEEMEQMRQMQN